MMFFLNWLTGLWFALFSIRRIHIFPGDSLPATLPERDLILAREDGEDWCVGMKCPCGCGDVIELLVVREARPVSQSIL